MKIIYALLLILFAVILVKLSLFTYKRVRLMIKLGRLVKETGGKIKYKMPPFLPNIFMAEEGDIELTVGKKTYYIRLFNGGGKKRCIHFASPEYCVRFTGRVSGPFGGKFGTHMINYANSTFYTGVKVYKMKPFNIPVSTNDGEGTERIMIFNPAPNYVSFVTEEKTTIKVAFTGDEFYGFKIFSLSSFIAYADRETRNSDDFVYF